MISIGLNLILGLLLFCALVLGLRLERKLRGLRDSHADFAKAVSELDQAAGRTEHSLAALRAGTETAKNEVASRIDQARIACQRLEKLTADADRAAERLAAQPLALLDRASPPPPRAPQAPQPPAPAPSAIARPEPEYLWADDMTAPRPPAPRPAAARPDPAPSRSRARMVDDDLFAPGPPPAVRQPVARAPAADAFATAAPAAQLRPAPPKADNDPMVGVQGRDRPARDSFDEGRYAHERRAMLAAVMGGRR